MHKAELLFPRDSVTDLRVYQSEGLSFDVYQGVTEAGRLVVEFETQGGVGFKVETRDARFDAATCKILDILEGLTQHKLQSAKASPPASISTWMSMTERQTNSLQHLKLS